MLILGMAVGVDYSLFYLRREREERARGRSSAEALRAAAATSGRAIVISGLTVMISLAGLFLTGIDEFTGMAFGTIREPVTATAVAEGHALVVEVPLAGDGSDSVSSAALLALRNQVLPATLGTVSGVSFAVTGNTAVNDDWSAVLRARTPVVLAAVALLAFLVLMTAFRPVVLPVVSIGLNLLSVGAAYGLITLIFQDGHLQGLLGFSSYGAIAQWVPLFMFVFLFGLSMDYHVFILSRIRERRMAGTSTQDAVIGGIASSAGVVTSAAVIMVAVFSVFATLSFVDVKTLGVGLAFAVLLDATVVRGILVPAAMTMLGERCWYLPRRLSRLRGPLFEDSSAAGALASSSISV